VKAGIIGLIRFLAAGEALPAAGQLLASPSERATTSSPHLGRTTVASTTLGTRWDGFYVVRRVGIRSPRLHAGATVEQPAKC